jgi:Sulfotransferase domain
LRFCIIFIFFCFKAFGEEAWQKIHRECFKMFKDDWRRVYLASFPRSGNIWMRLLIEEATHVATSSVYIDVDTWHLPWSFPWTGYSTNHGYTGNCLFPDTGDIVVVKTHFPHLKAHPGDELKYIKAIYMVRHPVDCLYSFYLFSQSRHPDTPLMLREELIGFLASLRAFDAYWSAKDNVLSVRYEDLYESPFSVLKTALAFIGYEVKDEDIERAVSQHPPQGYMLKHLSSYPQSDLEYIEQNLSDYLQKYDYEIPHF